jgi:hypothetical protein
VYIFPRFSKRNLFMLIFITMSGSMIYFLLVTFKSKFNMLAINFDPKCQLDLNRTEYCLSTSTENECRQGERGAHARSPASRTPITH